MNNLYLVPSSGTSNPAAFSSGRNYAPSRTFRSLVSETDAAWHSATVERLNCLVALESGWDGYRAGPVRFDTAYFALRMLEASCGDDTPEPQIVPGSAGDLQVEWHLSAGDIEMHVSGPYQVHASVYIAGTAVELDLTNDFTPLAHWLNQLAEHEVASAAAA